MWKNKRHLLLLLPVCFVPLPLLLPLLFQESSYPSIRSYIRPACLPACLFCIIFSAYGSKHGEFHQLISFFTTRKQMNAMKYTNMLCSSTVTVVERKRKRNPSRVNLKEWPDDWLCSVFYIQISLWLGIKRQKNEKCWVFFFVVVAAASFEVENAHMPNTDWLLLRFVSCFEKLK